MLRLTLRTLLAYLDDTLSPAEARDIGQQIADQPAINDLVARIKSAMRKRRLMADSPDPDRAEIDPNDAAEYLDSALSPSRVTDLEKLILENDQHLAEVASVHQILSLVLGKPIDVRAGAKERAYRLVKATSRTHRELDPVGPRRGSNLSESQRMAEMPTLPGQEAVPPNRWGTAVAGVFLAGLLVVAIYFTLKNPGQPALPPMALQDAGQTAPPNLEPPTQEPAADESSDESTTPTPTDGAEEGTPTESKPMDPEDDASPANVPEPVVPPVDEASARPADPAQPAVVLPMDPLDALPEVDPLAIPRPKPTMTNSTDEPAEDSSESPASDSTKSPADAETPATEAPAEASPAEPEELDSTIPLATYDSPTGIFLRESNGTWSRLKPRTFLYTSDLLANPAPGRSKLKLSNGVVVEMIGLTRARLSTEGPADTVALVLEKGRLVVTAPDKPTRLVIRVGESAWAVTFDGSPTRLAAEHRLESLPKLGEDRSARCEVDVSAITGRAEIVTADQAVALEAGQHIVLSSGQSAIVPRASGATPAWADASLDSSVLKLLDRMSNEIPLGDGPSRHYRELVDDNNKEVRAFAISGLEVMGEIDSLVSLLRHPKFDAVRAACFSSLRAIAQQGGDSLQAVQAGLMRMFPAEIAKSLLESIVGYSDINQRSRATFTKLIDQLGSEELALREAAIANLIELTGEDFDFDPDAVSQRRETATSRWKKWLATQTDETLRQLHPGL
jgi:hypothetical protein